MKGPGKGPRIVIRVPADDGSSIVGAADRLLCDRFVVTIAPTVGNAKIAAFAAAVAIRDRLRDQCRRLELGLVETSGGTIGLGELGPLVRAYVLAGDRVRELHVRQVESRIPARGASKEQRS
jgi:hypothetical protein